MPEDSELGTEEFPILEIIDQFSQCSYVLLLTRIPPVLLLLLPSFARTVHVPTQSFMICRTAVYVLTAVLTLYLLPDGCDFVFIARGFSTWHRANSAKEIMLRNFVRLSMTIAAPHFKLLTRLRLSSRFLTSGQHKYSKHRDKIAATEVKLFDQTLPADVEMHYTKESVFGVFLLCTDHRSVHLNTSHSVSSLKCFAIGCSSCSMRSGAVGASMLSSAVTVASGGVYQSGHGKCYGLYHDTKGGIYHSVYHEMKGGIYQYICHATK